MYGSVVNRIMESGRYPEIVVGMGATVTMWSDRAPYTVVAVRRDRAGKVAEIDILGDRVSANKAVWPAQDYDITPADPEGTVYEQIDGRLRRKLPGASGWDHNPVHAQTWRMDRTGRLRRTSINPETGRRVMAPKGQGDGLVLGSRDYYSDPSF